LKKLFRVKLQKLINYDENGKTCYSCDSFGDAEITSRNLDSFGVFSQSFGTKLLGC
jgi:hypothetical protein